jgi:hypothetical protein
MDRKSTNLDAPYDKNNNKKEIKIVYDPTKSKTNNIAMQSINGTSSNTGGYTDSSENLAGESFFNPNNYILNDAYMHDDLSTLPSVDEKSILACLKNKFENRKYFVRKFKIRK